MKKLWILILVFYVLIGVRMASADDFINGFDDCLEAMAGVFSGYILHEGGHFFMGKLTNTDMDWHLNNWRNPITYTEYADNPRDAALVHASGIVTSLTASEIILRSESIDKRRPYVMGMMFYNVVNPILYAIDYKLLNRWNYRDSDGCHGDLECIENYTGHTKGNVFAYGTAFIAAIQGWRYIDALTNNRDRWYLRDDMRLNLLPVRNGGGMLSLEVDF